MYIGSVRGCGTNGCHDVYELAKMVEADLAVMNRSCRQINGPGSPIHSNEYRIALRVGTKTKYSVYEYHFMVQTSAGWWAEKHGNLESIP